MTKPGNSDPVEPTADKAPEPPTAETEPADGTADTPADDTAEKPAAPASPTPSSHESPTRVSGGPPNSSLAASTDNSGSEDAAAETKSSEEMAAAKAREAETAKPAKAWEAEPLMAELEKAPPPPREQALRAQAKRRFEEPPPRMLRFSFYFFTAAGLVWLFSMVLSLFYKQQIIDSQIKNNKDPKITADQIAGAVNQILWVVTIAALAFTILLALFGYKATEGTRRARTLVTIFAVILIIFHLFLNGTQLGILSAMFALIGLALLWAPSSRAYFPPRELP